MFARILFSRVVLKGIFATQKIRDFDMICLHQIKTKSFHYFARVLFSRNSAYAKFRENKTLAKISEFTVSLQFVWPVPMMARFYV